MYDVYKTRILNTTLHLIYGDNDNTQELSNKAQPKSILHSCVSV